MRLIYWFFIAVCLILGGCFSGSTLLYMDKGDIKFPNLVGNPSFETSDAKLPNSPQNWYIVTSSVDLTEPVVLDSTVALVGRQSLKLLKCEKNMYLVSDAFRINYKGVFYTKCSLKAARDMPKSTKVYFWAYDAAGNKKNSFHKSLKVKQNWNKAAINAGFLKNSVTFARIAIFIPQDAGNNVWLDDVGCYMVHQMSKE
jgi:hypothetical protein